MAGGDGSQAVVAMVAAELGLPYACIPAGTRNHFALDLGVDRDDVVGALDAFVGGRGETGRSCRGQRPGVRQQRLDRPLRRGRPARGLPRGEAADHPRHAARGRSGPRARGWTCAGAGPEGIEHSSGAAILVSNNRYRLGRAVGSGTRPRIDDGAAGDHRRLRRRREAGGRSSVPGRSGPRPRLRSTRTGPIAAGIDGEAVTLDAPLRFRILPAALRVRIAAAHPGASPSAAMPEGAWETVRALARIAYGEPRAAEIVAPMSEWLDEAKASRQPPSTERSPPSETPALDVAMRRLSRAADHGKLWFATAAALGPPRRARRPARGSEGPRLARHRLRLRQPRRQAAERPASARRGMRPRSSRGATSRCRARAPSPPATPPRPSPSPPAPPTRSRCSRRRCGRWRRWSATPESTPVSTIPADVLAGAFIGVSAAELAGRLLDR